MRIHILRHDGGADAEETFSRIARSHGYRTDIVDPRLQLFDCGHPDVVFARCEIDSLLDPLTSDYLSALHIYAREGIPVINNAEFLLRGQDKFLSHLAVERALDRTPIAGCFSPVTLRVRQIHELKQFAQLFVERFGSVVVKLPCSARGLGVWLAHSVEEVSQIAMAHQGSEAILLQQPIAKEADTSGRLRDMRIEVVRHPYTRRPYISRGYYRIGGDGEFLTNVSRGGSIARIEKIPRRLRQFVSLIFDAVGGDVAGIDIAHDTEGNYWFEEVNVAFETKQVTLDVLGDQIWHDALDLCVSRAALCTDA